jgi:hypothetical protein
MKRPETIIDLLRPELKALRRELMSDIVKKLQHTTRKSIRHRTDQRKQVIVRLIQETPEITNLQICRAMDKLQQQSPNYGPLRSWSSQFWREAYGRVPNRVHSYISSIRQSLR